MWINRRQYESGMNRRQMSFIIIVNALITLMIVLLVTWIVEWRRPDPESLAALYTPPPPVILAATATPPPQAAEPAVSTAVPTQAAATGDEVLYVVEAGDSLLGIASRYNVTIDALIQANNLANPDFVFSGQQLVIPVSPAAAATVESVAATRTSETAGPVISAIESAGATGDEAVLIVNESNTPVNLDGWRLEQLDGPSYTFGDVQLFAGSSVRVYSGSGEDNTVALFWDQPAALWSSGSTARLVDENGQEVDTRTLP